MDEDFVTKALNAIKTEADSKDLPMRKACRLAGLPECTFSRWKKGTASPGLLNFERLRVAVSNYRPERASKPSRRHRIAQAGE